MNALLTALSIIITFTAVYGFLLWVIIHGGTKKKYRGEGR